MQILFFSEIYYPHGSGGELATHLYAKLLASNGFKVLIITNKFSGESSVSRDGNLTILRFHLYTSPDPTKFSFLKRFDVLFSNAISKLIVNSDVIYVPRFWYSAILLAKFFKKPVLTHFHGYFPICPLATNYDVTKKSVCERNEWHCADCIYESERSTRKDIFNSVGSLVFNSTIGHCFRSIANLSDAIICVSEKQRGLIAEKVPSLRPKLYTVYNPLPHVSHTIIEGDAFGYFGGSSLLKGFGTLCKAMFFLKHESKSSPLRVYSTNLDFHSDTTEFIKQLGIIPYKRLDNKEYENIYRQIRAVIVPSVWSEPFGYVACEAMLKGRLVVGADTGGIPEVLEGCPGSWGFPANDYKKLAEILLIVRDLDNEEAVNLGIQNKETTERKFSDDRVLKMFTKVLANVTN